MTSPPEATATQSTRSQLADAGFLLALVFLTLFVTTFVFAEEEETSAAGSQASSIQELPIPAAERAQFEKMQDLDIVDTATAVAAVRDNTPQDDKYAFSWLELAGTVGLALLYLGFVYRMSFKEYREVISARFGPPERSTL